MTGKTPNPSPQLENGFTRIANELLEAIARYPFKAREYAVLIALVRLTYGYQRTQVELSINALADATGLDKGNLSKTIKTMIDDGVIIVEQGSRSRTFRVSKHYAGWKRWPDGCCFNNPSTQGHISTDGCQNDNLRKVNDCNTDSVGCQNDNQKVAKTTTEAPQQTEKKPRGNSDLRGGTEFAERKVKESTDHIGADSAESADCQNDNHLKLKPLEWAEFFRRHGLTNIPLVPAGKAIDTYLQFSREHVTTDEAIEAIAMGECANGEGWRPQTPAYYLAAIRGNRAAKKKGDPKAAQSKVSNRGQAYAKGSQLSKPASAIEKVKAAAAARYGSAHETDDDGYVIEGECHQIH